MLPQLGFIHDELQFEVDPNHVRDLCTSLVLSAVEAGEYYNLGLKSKQKQSKVITGAPPTNVIQQKSKRDQINKEDNTSRPRSSKQTERRSQDE